MMKSKYSVILLAVIFSTTLISCDPGELARNKVPAPLKNALTFTEAPKEGKSETKRKKLAEPKLNIVSPSEGGVYPVGKSLVFTADAMNREGYPPSGQELVWTAVNLKTQEKMMVGKGIKVVKVLEPAPYQINATLLYDKQQVKVKGKPKVKYKHMVKRINIRVAMSISGKVISGGKGVPDAELILTDITGEKELGTTKSDANGEFSLEFPQNLVSRLVVRKPGYSFSPLQRVFDFQGKSESVVFKGAKATIQDIMLTSSADSNEPLKKLCPGDKAYFKAGYKTDKRVTRVETSLVQPTPSGNIRELLGEAIETANVPNTLDPSSAQSLDVKVPSKLKPGTTSDHYSLVVTYYDTEGNSFSGISKSQIMVSPSECALAYTARGAEAQLKADQEKALEMYNKAEDYSSSSPSLQEDARVQEARLFNRGLAHLALAISAKRESPQQISHINKALADFAEVLKLHRTDAEAYLMRGVARYLRQNYADAVDEISKCLSNSPGMVAAYEIRAMAYLKTGDPSNLSKAIDDLTEALDMESDNENTRKLRKSALIHDIELADIIRAEKASAKKDSDSEEKIRIDLSKTPIPDLNEIIELKKFARRL